MWEVQYTSLLNSTIYQVQVLFKMWALDTGKQFIDCLLWVYPCKLFIVLVVVYWYFTFFERVGLGGWEDNITKRLDLEMYNLTGVQKLHVHVHVCVGLPNAL